MRFINPKTDFAFKKIFGSIDSPDILISILNALLRLEGEHRVSKVAILNPYQAPRIQGIKHSYLDVRAEDEKGKTYIIEIQVLNVAAIEKRILYNTCKAYANQLKEGESYKRLAHVIAITITDFVMFPQQDSVVNVFHMRGGGHAGEGNHLYNEDLQMVFAELPKFTQQEEALTNTLERWFYFLKHAEDLRVIPSSLAVEPAIVHALTIANKGHL